MQQPAPSDIAFETLRENLPFVKKVHVYEDAMNITNYPEGSLPVVKKIAADLRLPLSVSETIFSKNELSIYVKFISPNKSN